MLHVKHKGNGGMSSDDAEATAKTGAKQLDAYKWKPGQSGNPKGRPKNAKQKLSDTFLADMLEAWERDGKSAIERELRSAVLGQDGITLTTEAKSAEATLRILSENEEKKILTLNAQGQVREYSLLYRLSFEVKDSDGKTLLEPTELALQTSMAFSESEVLAKEAEVLAV